MNSFDSFDGWVENASPAENFLYQHLRYHRSKESEDAIINRFFKLFIEALNYPDPEVWQVVNRLANAAESDRQFKYTLNRCCYTLINYWYSQPRCHAAIPRLIELFEDLPTDDPGLAASRRIRELVARFTQTDQYEALSRLRQVFGEPDADNAYNAQHHQPVGTLLRHYPFLYDHSLLTKDSDHEQKRSIQNLKQQAEQRLGINLARYNSYRLGHSRKPIENPTRLSDQQLNQALDHYTGKSYEAKSYKEFASWFSTYSRSVKTFREFKEELVNDYLLLPIAAEIPKYRNNQFSRALREWARATLTDFDEQRLNSFTLVELIRQLLIFLLLQNRRRPIFVIFRRLLEDMGYTLTTGLLLRIVLLCSAARPALERCFSVMFNLHETRQRGDVPWLVESLEHTNIALVTNFGGFGFCH
ncbi:hypothetical protein [Almyronema epifaneia]|uniref:Uncharacterized protein n=1 Tax=Almyronema epifaneia S1 TaxID=2991925 RepID=A0ABW6IAH4_9CYAN